MKRRLLAILMAAVMTAGLAACGSSEATTSESSAAPAEESAADTEEAAASTEAAEGTEEAAVDPDDPWAGWADVDTSEHVVITYMTTGDAPSGDKAATVDSMLEKLNAILTEKVNAELEIYYIGWTDQLANYNRTLARMDGSVDLVGTASDWLDAWPNSKNGAFLELSEEMLQTYAPATWQSVSPEHWDLCKYNGNIYLMPEDNYAQWTNHGFIYRLDWAKEAGLEDGVHSWEDMTEYFRYVKEAYPDIIPWDSDGTAQMTMAGGWVSSHSDFVAIDGLSTGALWGGTRDDLYTIVTPAYTDTEMMVEFAKMMKEWDTIGVWPTDVLNNKATTNRDDYRIGRVAAEQHHTQTECEQRGHLVSHPNVLQRCTFQRKIASSRSNCKPGPEKNSGYGSIRARLRNSRPKRARYLLSRSVSFAELFPRRETANSLRPASAIVFDRRQISTTVFSRASSKRSNFSA